MYTLIATIVFGVAGQAPQTGHAINHEQFPTEEACLAKAEKAGPVLEQQIKSKLPEGSEVKVTFECKVNMHNDKNTL